MSEAKFKVFGIKSDGTRDLIAWAGADSIGEALSVWPDDDISKALGDTYDKIEIVRVGSGFDV